jgi:hypothetical protein
MSSWLQGDDEKASMQGPVPTVQRNGNRRFVTVTTVSGCLLLLRILEPPKSHAARRERHRPREDGLMHPADTSRFNLSAAFFDWRLSKP